MQEQDLGLVKRAVNGLLSNFDYERKELEPRWLKDLRTVVRKNDSVIGNFVEKLFEELHKSNADRRLGTILICDYFFQRSHKFRTDLLDHIQDLLLFAIETDPLHYPLPGPPEAAATLKRESLKIIKSWIDKFANGYSKLSTASQFLTECKHFDFRQANEQLLVERQRAEEERTRQLEQARKVGEKVQKLFDDSKIDIKRSLTECRTTIRLIYPDLFTDDNGGLDKPSTSNSADRTKLHGYKAGDTLSVMINTSKIEIQETANNTALVDVLRDSQVDLHKHMKLIKEWLRKLVEVGAASNPNIIKRLVEYKAQIAHELGRCKQLKIKRIKTQKDGSDSEGGDSDFEDVVKEDLEMDFPALDFSESNQVPNETMRKIEEAESKVKCEDELEAGPSGWEPKPGSSKEVNQVEPKIPKLSYGLDLKYWGRKVEPAMIPRNEFDGHPFWRASDPGDTVTTEVEDVYSSRQMTFVGERPVIKHKCRAPLANGKLCPRMDLKTCPFHGPIVHRDDMGFPVEELGRGSIEHMKLAEERIKRRQEEEEEEYLRDVEAATGVSLSNGGGRKRRLNRNTAYGTRRKREKTQTEMSRERLSKKLFNKSAIKRVTETLTQIQQERAQKPFASQFNYALQRR